MLAQQVGPPRVAAQPVTLYSPPTVPEQVQHAAYQAAHQSAMHPVMTIQPLAAEPQPVAAAVSAETAPVAATTDEPARVTFGLDQPVPAALAPDVPAQPVRSGPAADPTIVRRPAGLHSDEVRFAQKGEDRRRRMRELSASADVTSEEFKQQMEQPAYLRRQVALDQSAPSAERKISRFSLSDDNELLGDNRFLHDNVD